MTRSWLVLLVAPLCSSVLAAESLRPARAPFVNLGSLHPHRLFATYVIHSLFPTKHSKLKSYKKDIKGLRPAEKTLVCQRGSRPRHPADLSLGTHWLVARNTLLFLEEHIEAAYPHPCSGFTVATNGLVAMNDGELAGVMRTFAHGTVFKLDHPHVVASRAGSDSRLALAHLGSLLPEGLPFALVKVERSEPLHRKLRLFSLGDRKVD